jgi:hypothetical protein
MRAASSPDGPGREWIARRFGLIGPSVSDDRRSVIPASFEDNPHVEAAAVRHALVDLPEPRRSWLMCGDWAARVDPSTADGCLDR